MTQTQITWLQVNCGNTLLYPVSVRKFPSPERGVLCILTEKCRGSADCSVVDIESEVNRLALGKLRQSTTVPSQYEKLP